VALLLGPDELCAWLPGQAGLAHLRLEPHRPPSNPGARDRVQRWRRRGVPLTARVEGAVLVSSASLPSGLRAHIERARRAIGTALDPRPEDRQPSPESSRERRKGALLRALITGDRSSLSSETRSAFELSGTLHLLAISGLHVGWVFALTRIGVGSVLRRSASRALLRRADASAHAAAMLAALGYAALAGLGVPALRALLMAWAGTAAVLGGRPGASWNALLLAALAVLVLDPASLFEVGLWLSFLAVAGILLWRPAGSVASRLVGCTLGAGLATAPLLAGLGAPIPALTVLANLVAVPWFGSVVVPLGLASGAVGAALGGPAPGLLPLARAAAEVGIRLVSGFESADLLANLEHPLPAAACFSALGFGLRLAARGWHRAALLAGAAAALAGLAMALAPCAPRARPPSVLFLDVGHGDAVLLRAAREAWLVDAGPGGAGFDAGRSVVNPALRALRVARLDRLVLTHADLDHVGGAGSVLQRVPVGEIWLSLATYRDETLEPLRRVASRRGVPIRIVASGRAEQIGPVAVRTLWPPSVRGLQARNDASLVLRLDAPGGCVLLPGDISARIERTLSAETAPCAALKLAHHGSSTSTDPAWLARLDPELAIASAGRRTRGSLPHRRVRRRLGQSDVTLYETHRYGAIRIDLYALGPVVAPFRLAP
jgi:competence protein ComEC